MSVSLIRKNTVGSVLLQRLEDQPQAEACRLVARDGGITSVSVAQLMQRAHAFAEVFGCPNSDRRIVAVCLYHSLDLHAAFIGGILSGNIPTMLAPPSPRMEPAKYLASLQGMLNHVSPSHVVVDRETIEKLKGLVELNSLPAEFVCSEQVPDRAEFQPFQTGPGEVAVLQHSSGTTGLQKGVALSNRAILQHNEAYAQRIGLSTEDTIVSWLPLYHDMGFISCFLLPLLTRTLVVEISPFDWVMRPASLLNQIHRNRGTLCWLPNFAYSFLAANVKDEHLDEGLDLSCVRAWINSSEPVRDVSHQQFVKRFDGFGVGEHQLTASYAMAENVYAVTQSAPGEYKTLDICPLQFRQRHRAVQSSAAGSMRVVSNGKPVSTTDVRVIDEAGEILSEGEVGELCLRGTHRFSGYFGREDATAESIHDDWYHTGDLGFLHDGHLYVTGRKKDLIIVNGKNIYPADVEAVAGAVDGVNPGRVVAFGLVGESDGTEQLIVLAELEEGCSLHEKMVALKIRKEITQQMDISTGDVQIVPSRWLVKSTSGKFARNDNRSKYLSMQSEAA